MVCRVLQALAEASREDLLPRFGCSLPELPNRHWFGHGAAQESGAPRRASGAQKRGSDISRR